jgi:hypothetical protein
MCGGLSVGVAGQLHAVALQFGAQLGVVLDDPVVHHGQLACGVAVWVGVAIGRRTVGSPSGVAHPGGALQRRSPGRVEFGDQVSQRPSFAGHRQRAGRGEHRDTGGVVPAVLQPAQTMQDDVQSVSMSYVAHDSAHGRHASSTSSPRSDTVPAHGTHRSRGPPHG